MGAFSSLFLIPSRSPLQFAQFYRPFAQGIKYKRRTLLALISISKETNDTDDAHHKLKALTELGAHRKFERGRLNGF